jgi:hypothetical protein
MYSANSQSHLHRTFWSTSRCLLAGISSIRNEVFRGFPSVPPSIFQDILPLFHDFLLPNYVESITHQSSRILRSIIWDKFDSLLYISRPNSRTCFLSLDACVHRLPTALPHLTSNRPTAILVHERCAKCRKTDFCVLETKEHLERERILKTTLLFLMKPAHN